MVLKRNKKGQAAIEFLMTYGWMLLVVLIVGALIFSFVDFGSLLPNKIELTNSFRGDAQRLLASDSTDQVQFVVRFVGSRANQINASAADISLDAVGGKSCTFTSITDANSVAQTSGTVSFVNGQESVVTFDCSGGADLIESDVIEGTITMRYADPRTPGLNLVSSGSIRVSITQ